MICKSLDLTELTSCTPAEVQVFDYWSDQQFELELPGVLV